VFGLVKKVFSDKMAKWYGIWNDKTQGRFVKNHYRNLYLQKPVNRALFTYKQISIANKYFDDLRLK